MTHHENVKIVAFVGLPGVGKSSAVDYLTEKNYPKVYFGGVILHAVNEAGLDITPENEKYIREKLRADEGNDAVVNRINQQIRDLIASGQRRIIADGLYSWTEYKIMKKEFPGELTTVAIVAPKHLRHHRLQTRPIRPLTEDQANQRDWAEIENLEKGGPIAIADHTIINNKDLNHLYSQIDDELNHINFYS
ncbi:MAG: dephospho-CoA kinase [Chloroflexi bacterium]|nr:MAG: dephospho-CoA kinase [Chloroflexota bacterium]